MWLWQLPFVAYRELKELECQIFDKMNDLSKATGKQRDKLHLGVSHIKTSQFYGLDIQPMAVEVAKMTMMIAKELVGETYKNVQRNILKLLNLKKHCHWIIWMKTF